MSKITSSIQDRKFQEELIWYLGIKQDYSWVVEWVKDNFDPEEVYGDVILMKWAENHGYVEKSE